MPTPLVRIILFVADVQKCATFYREHFGFKALPDTAEPSEWAELDTGGCRLAFHRARGAKGPTGSKDHPHKIVFFAKDVNATRAVLISRGVSMKKVQSFESIQFCDGTDAEGHVFQISDRP